jgi:dTDP-D-glucose 4,6-dehydratase
MKALVTGGGGFLGGAIVRNWWQGAMLSARFRETSARR